MTVRPITVDHPNVKLMLRDLEFGPGSINDLSTALGISHDSVRRALVVARAAKLVHISAWERSRCPRPVYALGDLRDAPRPKPLTVAEYSQRYRAKRARNLKDIHL